ncbi:MULTISPECIES: NAD-dependent epimerase/dehydratase family protein [Pseudanabaena]|uniref:UDP-glucose 4-epimerase n=2 Tax=Pseudanabaena TaxID=1152 RepID=A0A9X4M7U2_9CYAN|nr:MULTISPECIES: NAD-dependent epimerase/dehydratase family protein [Pseudanabaena]MDG3494140.1 NAD-dependent epimerase/dehydratase family protein [Pseudanabaena catenata USMAC16]
MKILVMGGTRFIGVSLVKLLVSQGHEVTLFNRGKKPSPIAGLRTIIGDRTDPQQLQDKLRGESFEVIFDNNGRELSDTQPLVEIFRDRLQHFVYMSSAGVYLDSDILPYRETDATDPKSRHKGKLDTESYLQQLHSENGFPYTSIRPTYIYGPQNYNDVEAWFFDRIVRDRPIPIPGNGQFITQLGHVEDLARAMAAVLGNQQAIGEIYNISDNRYVTFVGLAKQCAIAAGKDPSQLNFVYYNPKDFDFGKKKAFPFRLQHFFAAIAKANQDLQWQPKYDLVSGLTTSFELDYLPSNRHQADIDFATDAQILDSAK